MRYRRTKTVERILELEEGRRIVYTVVRGIPVRNYRAEVLLTPEGAGSRIDWRATWDRTLAGRLVRRKLVLFYPEMVAQLVLAAERKSV